MGALIPAKTLDQVIRRNMLLLPHTRAMISRVRAGTGSGRALAMGDSTIMGYGSNGGAAPADMKSLSLPGQLSNMFNASGINAHFNSFMGNGGSHGSASPTAQWDTRITQGSSWGVGVNSMGGQSFVASTNTNALSFAPFVPVDTYTIWYITGGGLGTISADINGGTPVTQATAGASGIASFNITGTLALSTLNLKWSAGGNVYVIGVEAFNSAKKWVSIVNAGWDGSFSADCAVTTNAYSYANAISAIAPDLSLICFGINDWDTGIDPVVYAANLQVAITQALISGDVILLTPTPTDPNTNASLATQQTFINQIYALQAANPLLVVDNWARWASYAVSNPTGLYFDHIHPNAVGYADQAQNVFSNIAVQGENIPGATAGLMANRPASGALGQEYLMTDVGTGVKAMWNGTIWKPPAGIACIYKSAVKDTPHTGDTTETIMRIIPINPSLLSSHGSFEFNINGGATGTAGTKTFAAYLSATQAIAGFQFLNSASASNSLSEQFIKTVSNRDLVNAQVGSATSNVGTGSSSAINAIGSAATNAQLYAVFTIKLANAADSAYYDDLLINWVE